MRKNTNKLGFTLIELLVVITIIGILATGATTIYTSQLQKARDSTRVTSMKALQGSVEQFYSDISEYPSTKSYGSVTTCDQGDGNNELDCVIDLGYMRKLPKDPKDGQKGAGSPLLMDYKVQNDTNGVNNQWYELSEGFEAKASVLSKAKKDSGSDANRLEVGSATDVINTSFASCTTTNTSSPYDSTSVDCKGKTTGTMFTNGATDTDDKIMIVNG